MQESNFHVHLEYDERFMCSISQKYPDSFHPRNRPSIFDSSPKDVAEKPLYDSDKSSDSETTDFASCVSSVKSSSSKTNEPLASAPSSVDFKTVSETADQQPSSTNDDSSFSFKENVKPPRNLCNKSGITDLLIAGSRNRPTSIPAGSRNRPTSVPAGRPFSAGWKNHAARPMTRPTSHYFQHFHRPGYYNQMYMDDGRDGECVKALTVVLENSKAKYAMGIQEQWWISSIYMENPHKNRDLGIVDSGCYRSTTGNKEKLDDFVKIVGELQNFNLFSVSQICDTKNKVLFTDKECLVLSKEFQLPENSQVVLRVPRRNNLYCFNLSDIKPERDVTCLLAKASLVESTKWHRRMAHVNFKNMNKLAKHGLVNGLPSKLFTNEHNCVAATKESNTRSSLQGPSHAHDFRGILWVFFLGTKDETYGILKDFITFIENQLTKKVKAIRCDNGTEFKNSKLIELCGSKGIKRDYSNARTPQQNRVAERKNRTLIEAARTLLADYVTYMFWTGSSPKVHDASEMDGEQF
ncbi:putative ribonuclease H-like domain-containing protein [Tanacetum coccineum]